MVQMKANQFAITTAIAIGCSSLGMSANAESTNPNHFSSEIALLEELGFLPEPTLEQQVAREVLLAQQDASDNTASPLQRHHPYFPTAQHLPQGNVSVQIHNRQFFGSSIDPGDTQANPTVGFSWGITDDTELTFTYHRLNTGGFGRQGNFRSTRNSLSDNPFLDSQEVTLQLKQRLWESDTESLSAVVSASVGDRGFRFTGNGKVVEGVRQGIVPGVQLPYTTTLSDEGDFQLTLAPTVAFFDEENALHVHQTPSDNPDDFGTTLGISGAVSYQVTPRFILWGDLFAPLTGNNTVDRDTGESEKTVAYNAGLRYMANPQLALDVFASNRLGRTGPLAQTADQGQVAVGAGVEFFPNFIGANRRYGEAFPGEETVSPLTEDGFAFYDGGILNSGQFVTNIQGGSQGVLTSLRFSPVRDLELGIYLDYVSGEVDESEQGIGAKFRLLDQAQGDPFTASLAATVGITNQPFVNFANNNRNEFDNRNLSKQVPFFLQVDDGQEGKLFVATVALPLHYRFDNGVSTWATPMFAFVQRDDIEIAGVNVGGSIALSDDLNVIGEVGANFAGEGNGFVDEDNNQLEDALAYTVGLRWELAKVLGTTSSQFEPSPKLELYLTNRVGSSTFHSLRVRDNNDVAVGVGLSLPFP